MRPAARRALGRRRRRLYWTAGLLAAATLAGSAIGVVLHRAGRPDVYRPGEANDGITKDLTRGLPPHAPAPRLVDVTREAGLDGFRSFAGERTSQLPEDMGPGAAWGDFDNDGDDDLFLVSAGGPLGAPPATLAPSLLYENLGDGTFERVAAFPDTRILGMGAAWGDADGDGWLDLAVTGFDALRLYRNERGKLARDTRLPEPHGFWAGASWADYDRDGDLDLYVCGYVRYEAERTGPRRSSKQYGRDVPYTLNPASFEPERNLLFRNDGAAGFREVAGELGVANPEGRSLSALWFDLDDDGWPDLYVANDISDNVLYLNRNGRFEDRSHAAWVADYRGAMGLAAGDWNRDGDDDLVVTHWVAQENALYDSMRVGDAENALRFIDVADQRGLGQIALPYVGWGVEFADFDADGWLDLVVANGSTFEGDETPRRLVPQPAFLFWNRQGEHFHDLAPAVEALAVPRVGRGLGVADHDLDGDLDVLLVDREAGALLLRNDMQTGNWLELRLRDKPDGRPEATGFADGARLVARAGAATLRRTVASASYLSQSSRAVHFGLGDVPVVESLEVWWPSGAREAFDDLPANSRWELREGDGTPLRLGSGVLSRERRLEFWSKQRAAMDAMKVEGDRQGAIRLFREALAIDPAHEDSLYYLGNCLAEEGDVEGALALFLDLTRSNPMSHRGLKRWGTLRALTAGSAGDLDEAALALERAAAVNPEETGAQLVLGEIALLRGAPEEAARRLDWVRRTNPGANDAHFFRSYLAWAASDPRLARELLRLAATRREERKPVGAVAEGDVRRVMHADPTLLRRFFLAWDGSEDCDVAFRDLDAHVRGERRRLLGTAP